MSDAVTNSVLTELGKKLVAGSLSDASLILTSGTVGPAVIGTVDRAPSRGRWVTTPCTDAACASGSKAS